MAYTNFQNCTANEYKNIVYNQETHNKIRILFNNVDYFNDDADEYCESFEVVSRVIPNGSKTFMLENLVSQEATLVLHNIDTSIIQDQVSISIGTLVSENTYEYVPIGIYNLQEIPTTDNGKTTIKLRDNSVKLDFNYNAKPLIDEHGGTATKLQILQDICTKAGIICNVSSFIGSSDLIGIYDNTITGRQYVAYLAGSAGAIPIITRSGALDFKYLNNLSTIEIPIEIVEQYSNAEKFKISRVVYEDAIRKYESGNETYDTLFLDSANPYISSQEQVASIYNIVNNFEINSFKTGRILGNPAIDSYDLIQITDYDNTVFKTFANNTLRYNGKMINTFASEISFERKKENVSLKSGATFKKWAKTEIDNANAQITIQAGQIDEIEQELANPTSTKENKYFDLEDALDEPLIDFSLYGETQQDSTTGKNKLGLVDGTYTNSGITAKVSNGIIKLSGTNSSSGARTIQIAISTTLENSTEYIFRNDSNKTLGSNAVQMRYYLGDDNTYTTVSLGDLTKTTLSSGTNFNVYVRVAGSFNANGYEIKPMIRLSNVSDNSWEPYTNGASPSPDYPQPIHNVSGDNTIEICGKNLWDFDNRTMMSASSSSYNIKDTTKIYNAMSRQGNRLNNYVTYTSNPDGSMTISTTTSYYGLALPFKLIPNETYTISAIISDKTKFSYGIGYFDSEGNYISDNSSYHKDFLTFTVPSNAYITNICICPTSSNTDITLSKIQLEKGNQSSEYEAYKSQSQLISLGVENLFDKDSPNIIPNKYLDTNGDLQNATKSSVSDYIKVLPSTIYSMQPYNNVSQRLCFYNSSKTFISSVSLTSINPNFTTPNNCEYIRTSFITSDIDIWQIEKGSKKNSYSEYGKPYIELCKINTYQDYIYKENDRWFLHKEIGKKVFNGSEASWTLRETNTNTIRMTCDTLQSLGIAPQKTPLSNYFIGKADNTEIGDYDNPSIAPRDNGNGFTIRMSLSIATTKAEFTTWLSTHNTIVDYVLATPTDTEITDARLLEQLNNLMALPLYKNMTHITLTPNDLQPTMKIEYYRDTSINNNYLPREEITKYYTKTETNSQIEISNSSIKSDVAEIQTTLDDNGNAINIISNQVQNLQTSTSQQINIINEQLENGVEKVKTTTGYTFDSNGLGITKGEEFENLITDRNQQISSNNKEILFMGYDDNLKKTVARIPELESRQATIGVHRTEILYEDGEYWTADFYVGGGN